MQKFKVYYMKSIIKDIYYFKIKHTILVCLEEDTFYKYLYTNQY